MKTQLKVLVLCFVLLICSIFVLVFYINIKSPKNDISYFTKNESWCGRGKILINPSALPNSGCFSLTNENKVLGKYKNHNLEISRDGKGEIAYTLDGVILNGRYESKTGGYIYTSPFVRTQGNYSWEFCSDVEHLDCPLRIDFLGDSADKTAVSSIFAIANCSDNICEFGK